MKQRKNRRPFARSSRRAASASAAATPVFQPLEPRKLLTTLYANPDLDQGQTDRFFGWVAMPAWYDARFMTPLDASTVEERSVRLGIMLLDSNLNSTASVTILDLEGNPLFPWIGLQSDGEFSTDVEYASRIGPVPPNPSDAFWGSDDDESDSGFGLDIGYNPGWRVATDSMGNFLPGVWIPDGQFHPVRQIDWLEDETPPQWDTENVPDNFTLVIPETGYWDPGEDGEYGTEDDARLPIEFNGVFNGAGTDDRQLGTADDQWVGNFASNPFAAPNTNTFEPHLVDRRTGWTGSLNAHANDGKADFNNGIGRIILSNTTITTRLVFFIIEDFEELIPGVPFDVAAPFVEPEGDRIGVAMNTDGTVYQAPGMGTIIIGNPTNANWTLLPSNPFFLAPGFQSYDRSTEGIVFEDPSLNETMGRVYIDGALFGVSRFPGALERVQVGYFGGKMFVDGDFDTFNVVGDAGYYEVNGNPTDTRAGLTVGRVLGSFVTGRNNSTFINVQGDFAPDSLVDKPFLRADKVVIEHEQDIFMGDEDAYQLSFASGNMLYTLNREGEEPVYLRNDTFGTAQYIGRETGFTTITGSLGTEPDDDQHEIGNGGDDIDVYAVAVDRNRQLRIQLNIVEIVTLRDAEGNILQSRGANGTTGDIFYTPNNSGVLYIVIEHTGGFAPAGTPYVLTVSNAAAATLGEVRSLGSLTYRVVDGSAITTQVGSIGSIRIGQDAGEDSDGDAPFIGNVLIQSADNIWNITSGGFIGGTVTEDDTFVIFGTIITATNNIAEVLTGYGRDTEQGGGEAGFHGGSIAGATINAGKDIGIIRAKAAGGLFGELGRDYGDFGGIAEADGNAINSVTTLTEIIAGGSIGVLSAESRILADPDPNLGLRVQVGAGRFIDLVEAGAQQYLNFDLEAAPIVAGVQDGQALITTGLGGNVRFFRAPSVWGNGVADATLDITSGQSITLIDDSGAIFTVRVTGAGSFAQIRTHAVQSSVGVATARITAALGNNGRLIVTNNSGNVEIGDVIVTGTGNGTVTFDGSGRTDVYMIRAFGGLNRIENKTSGDIVAIDTDGLNTLRISGNLGRTFTSAAVGQRLLLGPQYVMALGTAGAVGESLNYDPDSGSGGDPYLAGAPFDQWLNGLAARAAGGFNTVNQVRVEGTIVDVYAETNLNRIIANADNDVQFGVFQGVEGAIYSQAFISRIDLGDGLVETGSGPFVTGYIGAGATVQRVEIRGEGHDIRGTIIGFGLGGAVDGIGRINAMQGASIIGAVIAASTLDSYFTNGVEGANDSDSGPVADINFIRVIGGDIVNSRILGVNVNRVDIRDGVWDSNRLRADGDLNIVRADEFMFRYAEDPAGVNLITVARDFNRLETQRRQGDIKDLTVDVIGDMRSLRAQSIVRSFIDVDEELRQVDARGRIVASSFRAGAVTKFNAMDDITRVDFTAAGPVKQFRSRNASIIRLNFTVDGPDGRLDLMDARTDITGDIRVSGEVRNLRTRDGDINARIETFSGDGLIRTIQSGRDMILDLDADQGIDRMTVGRNLTGRDGEALKIRGDFGTLDVRNGSFTGSMIVEGSITRAFNIQTFAGASEIVVRGSIATISLDSGMAGSIRAHTDSIRRLDIDGTLSGTVLARNASIDSLNVNGGDVTGSVTADEGIRNMRVTAASALGGASGSVTGVITSGTDIDRLDIEGDLNGARVMALWNLNNTTVRGNATGSLISAGMEVSRLDIMGNADSSHILGGLESLGADNALGGVADNADTYSNGQVENVTIRGGINNLVIAAGVRGGSDGDFSTLNAATDLAPGLSNVDDVRVDGAASGTNRIIADTTLSRIFVDGTERTVGNPGSNMVLVELDPAPLNNGGTSFTEAAPVVFTDSDGDQITLSMRGAGTGMYLLSGGGSGNLTGLVFNGTDSRTNVDIEVTSATGNGRVDLDNVHIQFADDADLGNLTIEGHIDGTDAITIDGSVNTITARTVNTSGTIAVGGEARRILVDTVTAGLFRVTNLTTFDVQSGGFGGRIFSETLGTLNVRNGVLNGVVWGRDSIGTINNNSTGAVMDRASISTRGEINSINAATIRNVTLISAGDLINNINISGDLIDSEILAGVSLGSDGRYEGTGTAADQLSGGTINSVRINGSSVRSSIAAGVIRGADQFYGTGDDLASSGFGILGRVDISGGVQGSNFNSQNWAFTASERVDSVRVGGQEFIQQGNVRKTSVDATPLPLTVTNIRTRLEAETFYIDIFFNEDVDLSTVLLDPGNPQAESSIAFENPIDPNGVIPEPNDAYDILYDRAERRATVRFTRAFSRDNPGIYTLVIDGSAIRTVTGVGLDANRDGFVGDDYRKNFIIGDAGDRVNAGTWDPDGDPNTNNSVDFAAASRLDLLLDDLVGGTGIRNHELSFVGRIGDHPDTESFFFPQKFDVDVYRISLQAGDIFQASLTAFLQGSGFIGSVTLRDAMGNTVVSEATLGAGYVEQSGGTYYLTIAGTRLIPPNPPPGLDELIDISNSTGVFTLPPFPTPINPNDVSNDIGTYELNVLIFNDGNTGFSLADDTDLVDGQALNIHGTLGFETNGIVTEALSDIDVYDISRVLLSDNTLTTQLEEGMNLTVTLRLSQVGGNLGGRYEVGVFQTTESVGIGDGLLMGAPATVDVPAGEGGTAGDVTFTFQIPEAGNYAILVQGSLMTDYELIITVDTSTQGDRLPAAYEQNILLELNGGFASWYGLEGTTLSAFDLDIIGFKGTEAQVISLILDEITQDFADAGITVNVSTNPAQFVGEEFTTVFLSNNIEPGLYGIAQTLDPQNQSKTDEAIVFIPTFASLIAPGQIDLLASALADVISHEVAHTLGLRHAFNPDPFGPIGMMDTSLPPSVEHQFIGDPNDPYGTASILGDAWFFGRENEVHLLQLIFDVDT